MACVPVDFCRRGRRALWLWLVQLQCPWEARHHVSDFHHAVNVKTEAEAFRIINTCVVWKTGPSVATGQTPPLFVDGWYGPKAKLWVRGQVEDALQGDICPQR